MMTIDTPESRELSERYGVSLATATRWIRRGKERSVARFLARREAEYGVAKAQAHGWGVDNAEAAE
jgi:transposase